MILVEERDGVEVETLLVDRHGYVPTATEDQYYWGAERSTNNTAELTGLGEAIWAAMNEIPPEIQTVHIMSDSCYGINAVLKNIRIRKNKILVQQIQQMNE